MRIPVAVVAGVALLALAGCASPATPAPQISVPGLLGGGGPVATAAPLGTTDVCAAFPVRAVARASGWHLTSSAPVTSSVGSASAAECRYRGASGVLRLVVVPGGGDAALTTLIASPELGGGAIVVTGVGDAAQAALGGIVVRYGDDVVAVIEQPTASRLPLATTRELAVSLHERVTR